MFGFGNVKYKKIILYHTGSQGDADMNILAQHFVDIN